MGLGVVLTLEAAVTSRKQEAAKTRRDPTEDACITILWAGKVRSDQEKGPSQLRPGSAVVKEKSYLRRQVEGYRRGSTQANSRRKLSSGQVGWPSCR